MAECNNNENPPEIEAMFPDGSAPETRLSTISSLCSYGMRPHVMTGLLRQLLISHFCDPDNIEEARLRKYAKTSGGWKPVDGGLNGSGFLIESITRWKPTMADAGPAILIRREKWSWRKINIGNKSGEDLTTGTKYYSGQWQGAHTLMCRSQNGAEVEVLTTEVVKFLLHYSPLIITQMNLMSFYVAEVGAIEEPKEVAKGYAVPVTVAYVAEENWSLQPYAPRLKRIVLRASDLTSY